MVALVHFALSLKFSLSESYYKVLDAAAKVLDD